jgi:hypothetical protein
MKTKMEMAAQNNQAGINVDNAIKRKSTHNFNIIGSKEAVLSLFQRCMAKYMVSCKP